MHQSNPMSSPTSFPIKDATGMEHVRNVDGALRSADSRSEKDMLKSFSFILTLVENER